MERSFITPSQKKEYNSLNDDNYVDYESDQSNFLNNEDSDQNNNIYEFSIIPKSNKEEPNYFSECNDSPAPISPINNNSNNIPNKALEELNDFSLFQNGNEEDSIDNNMEKQGDFQKEDFVNTPSGDNDDIIYHNNLNSKTPNLNNNCINNIQLETPENNNLSNSSSQNKNKSSILSSSLNNNTPLNNSLNKKIDENCKTLSGLEKPEEDKTFVTLKKGKTKRGKTKFKLEGIRKKIKSRLHKRLKAYYNKKLKDCGSKMFLDSFPQSFITNVNVANNKTYLKLTIRTLLTMIFGTRAKDKEKISVNKKLLQYLDNHPDIRINSGIDKFLNSSYKDVINEYINGDLFLKDIEKLKKENKSKEYIDKYIDIAKHWIEFYENGKILKTPKG